MIKAVSYWGTKDGMAGTEPIARALEAAKAAGFAGLELCLGTDGVLTTKTTQADCQAIRAAINQAGMVVETLACGISWGVNPASDDPAVRAQAVALHAAALERAGWLGCQAMLMVPGVAKCPFVPGVVRYDVAVQRVRAAVQELLPVAERAGVDLCLENVWNGLFLSPLEFRDFIESFGSTRVGVYFDVGNGLGYHQHPPHWIELLGRHIKRVHVKDFLENFGWLGSYAFCDLGAGQVPWPETVAALRKVGYNATLVAELLPWDATRLERTSAALDKIMKM